MLPFRQESASRVVSRPFIHLGDKISGFGWGKVANGVHDGSDPGMALESNARKPVDGAQRESSYRYKTLAQVQLCSSSNILDRMSTSSE